MLDITLLLFLRAVCTDRSIIESILVASPEHKPDLLSILSSLHERAWLDNDMASAGLSGSKSEKRHLLALREYCIKHEHAIDVSKPIRIVSAKTCTLRAQLIAFSS